MIRKVIRNSLAALLLLSINMPSSYAQENSLYNTLADFVLNMPDHIEWSPAPRQVHLCIYGYDPIALVLQERAARSSSQGKPISIITVNQSAEIKRNQCHIIYIAASKEEEANHIIDHSAENQLVTVSNAEGFLEKGGVIEFSLIHGKVRLSANEAFFKKTNLRPSPLLRQFFK